MNDFVLLSSTYMISKLPAEQAKAGSDQSNTGKVFHGDGDYYLPNGTSAVRVSGDDVIRINLVNGVPANAYGILDGKFVMGNMPTGNSLIPLGGSSTILGLPAPASTSAGVLPNPYQNAGSLTYTPTEVRPSQIFISNPKFMTLGLEGNTVGFNPVTPFSFITVSPLTGLYT